MFKISFIRVNDSTFLKIRTMAIEKKKKEKTLRSEKKLRNTIRRLGRPEGEIQIPSWLYQCLGAVLSLG